MLRRSGIRLCGRKIPARYAALHVPGCDAVLRTLTERAESEFPAALPAVKQLLIYTAEVEHSEWTPEEIHKLPGSDTPAPRQPPWWNRLRNG